MASQPLCDPAPHHTPFLAARPSCGHALWTWMHDKGFGHLYGRCECRRVGRDWCAFVAEAPGKCHYPPLGGMCCFHTTKKAFEIKCLFSFSFFLFWEEKQSLYLEMCQILRFGVGQGPPSPFLRLIEIWVWASLAVFRECSPSPVLPSQPNSFGEIDGVTNALETVPRNFFKM